MTETQVWKEGDRVTFFLKTRRGDQRVRATIERVCAHWGTVDVKFRDPDARSSKHNREAGVRTFQIKASEVLPVPHTW